MAKQIDTDLLARAIVRARGMALMPVMQQDTIVARALTSGINSVVIAIAQELIKSGISFDYEKFRKQCQVNWEDVT